VGVAHRHRGVDRRGVDVDVDLRRPWMRRIDHDRTRERGEAAAHEREHRVAGDELERRVRRIDLPGSREREEVLAGANVDDRMVVVGHAGPRFVHAGSAILPQLPAGRIARARGFGVGTIVGPVLAPAPSSTNPCGTFGGGSPRRPVAARSAS
jgi:hypothetical protein